MGEYTSFINEIKGANYRGTNFIEYNDKGGEIYISFQTLLRFLNEYVNLNSNNKPIIKIDWENDKPCFAYSTTISGNLLTCYVYNDYLKTTQGALYNNGVATFHPFTAFKEENNNITKLQTTLKNNSGSPSDYSIYPSIGNINYIYLNAGYISELLTKESDNADNKTSVQKLLQNICNDVNKALGSINDFQVIIDDDNNLLTIVDFNQKRIKGLSNISNDALTTIKAQGLGSFVTSINAQSSITPEMATMISVGAQKDGNVLGEEATSLSRLSNGLLDRIYPEKEVANSKNIKNINKDNLSAFESIVASYKELIGNQLAVDNTGGRISFKSDSKINVENVPVELYKACLGKFTTTNQTSTTFIPIKLDFSLSGISGIKIFQKFNITNDVLPYIYNNNFSFIVTGISHEISNNNIWSTKISSLITIKDEDVKALESTYIPIGDITLTNNTAESLSSYFKGSIASTTDETVSFLTDILKGLNIPNPNQYQIQFMKAWRQHEGASAAWNPFNTTYNAVGSKNYNTVGVKNYPNRATGLQATINTLSLPAYSNIIQTIKDIKTESDINKAMQAVNDSPWGSKFTPPFISSWKSLTNLIYKEPVISRT